MTLLPDELDELDDVPLEPELPLDLEVDLDLVLFHSASLKSLVFILYSLFFIDCMLIAVLVPLA